MNCACCQYAERGLKYGNIFVCVLSTVQDIVFQLQRFVTAVTEYHENSYAVLKEANVFPIEVDLTRGILGNTLK